MSLVTREFTDNHTLDGTDLANINAGDMLVIEMNKATALSLTIPQASDLALPTRAIIAVRRTGEGALTLVGADNMVLTSTSTGLTDPGKNIIMTLEVRGANDILVQNGAPPPQAWESWIPDPTGISSFSVKNGSYCVDRANKTVTVRGTLIAVSNTNAFTITNLPLTPKNGATFLAWAVSGTTNVTSRVSLTGGSSVMTFHAGLGSETWATSNAKNTSFTITYEYQ